MATKFCVFCGKELPVDALFCQFCGERQPEIKSSTEKEKPKEEVSEAVTGDNIEEPTSEISPEMKLLMQAGLLKPEKVEREYKEEAKNPEPPKVILGDPEEKVKTIQIKTAAKPVRKIKPIEEKKQEDTIPEIKEPDIEEKSLDQVQKEDFDNLDEEGEQFSSVGLHEFDASDYDEYEDEESEEMEEIFEILEGKAPPVQTVVSDITEGIQKEAREEIASKEKSLNLEKETEKEEKSKPLNRFKRKNIPASDEDEMPEDLSRKRGKFVYDETAGMTMDEKADYKKAKERKEKEKEIRRQEKIGEGRKSNGRKHSVRENIDKLIESRKMEDIEQEEVGKKDLDPNYDGYYENVKPIDYDKQTDNTASIKVAAVGLGIIALSCVVFYLLFTFFMA